MQFTVLGPVQVVTSAGPVPVPGRLRAALLALLLVRGNATVPADTLVQELWDDGGPTGRQRLQTAVHKLRRLFDEPDRLRHDTGGYRLTVGPGELDADRFDTLLREARVAADPAARSALLRDALGLWCGRPFGGLDLPALALPAQQLAEDRITAAEDLHATELDLGRHRESVAELADLAVRHPLRERLHLLLVTALHRSDRQGEALAAYRAARRVLADELGLDPGAGLRGAEARILAGQDPLNGAAELVVPERADTAERTGTAARAVPDEVPAPPRDFTGRHTELAELDRLAGTAPVVVVAGGPGAGKTTLVRDWARRIGDRFPDGRLYADLQGFGPDDPVPADVALGAFLRTLGEDPAAVPVDPAERSARFRTLSAGRRLLVVLDDAASAEQVRPLLPASGSCLVVVTSRDRLDGLVVAEGARRLDVGPMTPEDARELLSAGLEPAPDGRRTERIVEQCARLPLALRVVAERLREAGPAGYGEVAGALDGEHDRLDLLDTGDPQTSLRTVLSWSYGRLGPEAARLFRLFGFGCPHPGHLIDVYGAGAMVGAPDLRAVRGLLAELTRCGLVEPVPGIGYRMHDLVRLYAAELTDRLDASPAAGHRLVDHLVHTAVRAGGFVRPRETGLLVGDTPRSPLPELDGGDRALGWLDGHLMNLMCAADVAVRMDRPAVVVDLSTTLWPYLDLSRHIDEARRLHGLAHTAVRDLGDTAAEGIVLRALGLLELATDRPESAYDHLREAHERHPADAPATTRTTTALYLAAAHSAAGRHTDALRAERELGPAGRDDSTTAMPLAALGRFLLRDGRRDDGVRVLHRAGAAAGIGHPVHTHVREQLAEADVH